MTSPSSQSPMFPLKVFHLILKNLSYSELMGDRIALDIDSLRRCSLVCKAWVPICQAYLFKSATIYSDAYGSERLSSSGLAPAKGIVPAIAAHPHIASYIQNIRYTTIVRGQEGYITDQNVSTFLRLPNLRSIRISAELGSLKSFDDLCSSDFVLVRLWEAYIPSTSLVDLTLEDIGDLPLATLLSCPNLKSLAVTYCDCADWQPQPVSNIVLRTSKIESLKLTNVGNISYTFLSFLPHLKKLVVRGVEWRIPRKSRDQLVSTLRGLEKLTFDYAYSDDRQLWVYVPLSIAAGMGVKLFVHLQKLTVMLQFEQEAEEIYQALQHAPRIHYLDVKLMKSSLLHYLNLHQFLPQSVGNLRTLHTRFRISHSDNWHDSIEVLSEALSLVKSPASLEELVIKVHLESTHLLALLGIIRQLKRLDTALFVDSSMFPLLRWITIHICIEYSGFYSPPTIDDNMRTDVYEYIESSFPEFRRSSPNSRLNIKLWLGKWHSDDD